MELVKSAGKRTSRFSEILHIAFNIGVAIAVLALVYFGVPVLAYLLVILSKWRVLAVRPRFWWANVKANALDLLLGLSAVTMLWQLSGVLWLQVAVTFLYMSWLVLLKPRSDQASIFAQAGITQFVAITAFFTVSFDWPSWAVVLVMWVLGYVCAQHALSSFEDEDVSLVSFIWALLVAELGWLAYHWTIAYSLVPGGVLQIPQMAFIVTLLGYFALSAYNTFVKKQKLRLSDVMYQAIFVSAIIIVILVFFNDITKG